MRIAFNSQIFCMQKYGGVSRYFSSLVDQLAEGAESPRVFAPFYQNEYLRSLSPELVNGKYVSYCPTRASNVFASMVQPLSRHDIKSWKPDVIHETYFSRYRTGGQETATVVTVHDMISELCFESNRESDVKRTAVERADHIICISENTKKDLMSLFSVPQEKISTVLHGFNQSLCLSRPLAQNPISLDSPFILYVGSRTGYKNFDSILKAIAQSKCLKTDFRVIAFGGGTWTNRETKLMAKLGFSKGQIRQTGGSDEWLATLYRAATAFVYPSKYEGFGLPPLEAMSCSCPVISSNSSSMPEVIGNAGELFIPTDLDNITESIEKVVYCESYRTTLIERGHEQLENFSWRKCAQETLSVYKRVVA